jgi:hypothetical protein
MKIECENEEQLKQLKDKAMKCKVIALHHKGKHPLYNPRNMREKDRKALTEDIEVLFRMDISEIDVRFNAIACEELLSDGKDVNSYPIYDLESMKAVTQEDLENELNSPIV